MIRSDKDEWISRDVAERLAKDIPGARLIRLPGVARLVPEEAPDRLVEIILDFVGGPRAASSGETVAATTK